MRSRAHAGPREGVDWEVGDEPAEGILEILAEWRRLHFERRG
jgi:hypothetical protein